MFGDQVQNRLHLVAQVAVLVHHGERGRAPHLGLGHQKLLVVPFADVIGGGDGRHPDHLAAHLQRVLHGIGVEAAERVVEHDGAERLHAEMRIALADQLDDRRGRVVVVLEQDRAHAGRGGLLHGIDMVDQARHHRRAAVAVQVDGATHQGVH